MGSFILRRIFYSLLIVFGVVLLTFLLFNVAGGDPAAAVLGKNAKPEEIESLRRELGADLPLFFGWRCATEAFPAWDGRRQDQPGVTVNSDGGVTIRRGFVSDFPVYAEYGDGGSIEVPPGASSVALPVGCGEVRFFRKQANPLNSQLVRAFGEVISFQRAFPYVRVFDFGRTVSTREPIGRILLRGVGPSLALMLPVFFGELLLGIAFALIAAAFKDSWIDRSLVCLSVCGISISYLVVIIFAQWFLGYYYSLFPVWGWESTANLWLPITVGVLCGIGGNVRFYRAVFVNELDREYLRTAIAKGASPTAVYGRHLLRNAALQIITRAGASLPFLFTGSLLLESFFGIPGLGFAGVDALYNSDLQLLKALVVAGAVLFVVINLLTDLAYAWADPRLSFAAK